METKAISLQVSTEETINVKSHLFEYSSYYT